MSDWYRRAMNNFWITREIPASRGGHKDYRKAAPSEQRAPDKILSFLIFLTACNQRTCLPWAGTTANG